jgi:NADH:ubiquinone oxidoreductase subunit F (NADH-binding)/NAD-dependent dihydropyrimidine dehydrogenase PreA subunit
MGTTLREIVFDIGGGIPEGKRFKAIQIGGPSGGCIPESLIDLPADYERLTEVGSMVGSGGMIVMDEATCMVDVTKYFLDFLRDESCGKCIPCREGIDQMYQVVTDITTGQAKESDLDLLLELAEVVADASLCALGGSAPNPVLTTLRFFRPEYEAHIRERRCPAHVCKGLIKYKIIEERCTGCGRCLKVCPNDAISGEKKKTHLINEGKCVKCGECLTVCKFEAVEVK